VVKFQFDGTIEWAMQVDQEADGKTSGYLDLYDEYFFADYMPKPDKG